MLPIYSKHGSRHGSNIVGLHLGPTFTRSMLGLSQSWDLPICQFPSTGHGAPLSLLGHRSDHQWTWSCRPNGGWMRKGRLLDDPNVLHIYIYIYLQCIYIYIYTGWWFQPSEKYESQSGWLFPVYGKTKKMFQTTNQYMSGGQNALPAIWTWPKWVVPYRLWRFVLPCYVQKYGIGKWVIPYRLWMFSHKFEHPMSTCPLRISRPLILSITLITYPNTSTDAGIYWHDVNRVSRCSSWRFLPNSPAVAGFQTFGSCRTGSLQLQPVSGRLMYPVTLLLGPEVVSSAT